MIARKSVNKKNRPKSLSNRNVAKCAENIFFPFRSIKIECGDEEWTLLESTYSYEKDINSDLEKILESKSWKDYKYKINLSITRESKNITDSNLQSQSSRYEYLSNLLQITSHL